MMRMIPTLLVALVGSAAMGGWAHAAEPYGPEEEALIRRGIEYRKTMDDLAARAEFQKAYDLTHSPRAAAQLGLAEFALGRWEDAEAHVGEALRSPKEPFIQKYRAQLDESLATIKNHIARVEVIGDPAGAEVLVNGRMAGRLPMTTPASVSAGQVEVELRAPGYRSGSRTLNLSGGQYQRLVIRLEKDLPPAQAQVGHDGSPKPTRPSPKDEGTPENDGGGPGSPAGGPSVHKIAKWTALGLAGAALATGVVAGIQYKINWDSFHEFRNMGCFDNNGKAVDRAGMPASDCQDALDRYKAAKPWMIVGFVGAGVFAATWAVLALTEPEDDTGGTVTARRSPTWMCTPGAADGPGATCAFQF